MMGTTLQENLREEAMTDWKGKETEVLDQNGDNENGK